MAKRPTTAGSDAATDAASDGKKPKPRGFVISDTIPAPEDVSPVLISAVNVEPKRALRKATAAATRVEKYGRHDFDKFAKHFEAAVASAFAETRGPVSLTKVITEMTKTTGTPKIGKYYKELFIWRGYARGRWQISRYVPGQGQVAFPKGSSDKHPNVWRFWPPAGGPV